MQNLKTLFGIWILMLVISALAVGCAQQQQESTTTTTSGGGTTTTTASTTTTTGGGETTTTTSTTTSTTTTTLETYSISGNANLLKTKEMTITPLAGVVVKVNPQTTTNDSGYYALTELPSGEVQITASKETGCICGASIITDSKDSVNFDFWELGEAVSGTARITGQITGVPTTTEVDSELWLSQFLDVKSLTGKTLNVNAKAYKNTGTYEVNNVPAGDTIYVIAKYTPPDKPRGEGYPLFAYSKILTSSGNNSLDIAFNNQTLEVTGITYPSGYQIIGFDIALINSSDYRYIGELGYFSGMVPPSPPPPSTTTFSVLGMPPLQTGDLYRVTIVATNEARQRITKHFYLTSYGQQSFSLADVPSLTLIQPTPGATLITLPTFEWSSISDVDFIWIMISDGWGKSVQLFAPATKTKIQFPEILSSFLKKGDQYLYTVDAIKMTNYPGAVNDTYKLNTNRHPENYYIHESKPVSTYADGKTNVFYWNGP